MKKFVKNILPVLSLAVFVFMASCGNPVGKTTYKCDEVPEITLEFAKDYSVVLFWTVDNVKRQDEEGDDKYVQKRFQIATGSYRVNGKLLTVTVGSARSFDDIKAVFEAKEDKWPMPIAGVVRGAEFTFQIQDGGKMVNNSDTRTWTKQ